MWETGRFALQLGLFLSAYAILVDLLGNRLERRDLHESGRNASVAVFLCLTVAVALLWTALLRSDFRLDYVARHTALRLPLLYKITALWAGASGSLLFWLWLQVGLSLGAFNRCPRGCGTFHASGRCALNLVNVFFLLVLILDKDPFQLSEVVPADGAGLNPLLQHPAMALHPPTLFVGYAAFAVPFAWAIAALAVPAAGRPAQTLRQAQAWILVAWGFLTVGIVLGAWWAYEELGWGGYWAWDPVENASLMPWLIATALLHCSRRIRAHTHMIGWFMALAVLTYSLCVFGTFLTRYGLVSSVHAFPDPGLGILFMVLLIVVWIVTLVLTVRRQLKGWMAASPELPTTLKPIVWNNVLFLVLTVVVLIGTLFPFLSGLVSSKQISLKPEYFTKITAPFGLALLLFIGVCPALVNFGWRSKWRLWGGGIVVVAAVAMRVWRPALAPIALMIAVFVAINLVADWMDRLRRGHRFTWRWVGARVVHVGVLLVFVGIAGADGYDRQRDVALRVGQTVEIEPFVLTFENLRTEHGPNYTSLEADLAVARDGRSLGVLHPGLAFYPNSNKRTSEVSIRRSLARDLYTALTQVDQEAGVINLTVMVKPLINWIWIGSIVAVLGTVLALGGLVTETRGDESDEGGA